MNVTPEAASAVRVRTFRPGDDASMVELLNAAFPGGWGTLERWRAKHSARAGFDPVDIYLAELDGRLVGCLHTAIIPVRIDGGLTLRLSLDGDLAVHPDARGHSIPEILYNESRRHLYERGVPLRGGYTELGLWTGFYRPRIGHVSDFDVTRTFKRILDHRPVRDRLLALFGSTSAVKDPGDGPVLEVRIVGISPFQIRLGRDTVAEIAAGRRERPAITLSADQRIFAAFGEEGGTVRRLLALWRRKGLRLNSGPGGVLRAGWWFLIPGRRLKS